MAQPMTLIHILKDAESKLDASGIETARLDAEVLLAWTLGTDRASLYGMREAAISEEDRARFEEAIDRRAERCPVAYITGVKEFWSLPIAVTPDVLIPRPETETVVEEALRLAGDRSRELAILDLCTGSGCIAAALAAELPRARITVADSSRAALDVARRNLAFAGSRMTFFAGDLFGALPHPGQLPPFDLITANPPYIADGEYARLPRDIAGFEPRAALAGGENGLDFVERIIEDAPRFLVPGGFLVMEMGQGQAHACTSMALGTEQYDTLRTAKDLAGIERVLIARRSRFS
jgi:release factor glutamine methyltransferase